MLLLATILIVAIGFAHSFLGERYILIRLFRQPKRLNSYRMMLFLDQFMDLSDTSPCVWTN